MLTNNVAAREHESEKIHLINATIQCKQHIEFPNKSSVSDDSVSVAFAQSGLAFKGRLAPNNETDKRDLFAQ